jgi:hypothetical protein
MGLCFGKKKSEASDFPCWKNMLKVKEVYFDERIVSS